MSLDRAKRKLKILGIFAHPHDYTHCLGTLGHHVRDGDSATVVILTDGASTHNEKLWREWMKSPEEQDEAVLRETRDQYSAMKRQEVEKACSYFGITDVRLLGYPDKPITRTDEMVQRVADLIYEVRPDILITELPERLNPDKFFAEPEDHSTCAAVVNEAYTLVHHPKPGERRGYHHVARKYYCAPSMSYDEVLSRRHLRPVREPHQGGDGLRIPGTHPRIRPDPVREELRPQRLVCPDRRSHRCGPSTCHRSRYRSERRHGVRTARAPRLD